MRSSDFHQALFLERAQDRRGFRDFARQICAGERTDIKQPQQFAGRIGRAVVEMKLARRVVARGGERIHLAVADVGCERRHGAQSLAQGRAIVLGDPAAQLQQPGIEHRLFIQQPQSFARLGQRRFPWVRRTTPATVRFPNGTSTRQPVLTRCRKVSGSR